MRREKLFDLPITVETNIAEIIHHLKQKIDDCVITTFINPHSFYLKNKNSEYLPLLNQFDMILPDGSGVQKAAEWFLKIPCERISFDSTSMALPVFEWCQKESKKMALIGGKPGIAEKAAKMLLNSFPSLPIAQILNGHIPAPALVEAILKENPAVVLCGMGAPQQENFLILLKKSGWKGVGFTCGGYFDQLVNGIQYYPKFIDQNNLRWLYRLLKEPKRLWRRYFIEYQPFVFCAVLALFGMKKMTGDISLQPNLKGGFTPAVSSEPRLSTPDKPLRFSEPYDPRKNPRLESSADSPALSSLPETSSSTRSPWPPSRPYP
jgi:N-acetylglucosaminyldiphosphoundecaprenol N-acetyl-beta-D-mannosaminyltransferase